jgi:hypothetical protein
MAVEHASAVPVTDPVKAILHYLVSDSKHEYIREWAQRMLTHGESCGTFRSILDSQRQPLTDANATPQGER